MKEIVWKNPWSDRFIFLEKHIPEDVTIVDFGCGNKQILDYCSPIEYLGIDLCEDADIKIDLSQDFKLDKKYDVGLVLGLLEHLDNPQKTLENCFKYADKFIVLTSNAKMKSEWRSKFSKDDIEIFLKNYFKKVTCFSYSRYTVSVAEEKL